MVSRKGVSVDMHHSELGDGGWMSSLHVLALEAASPRGNHGDVSSAVSTLRSPASVLLHLLTLQLKPSLTGLRAVEFPLFTTTWF